MCTLASRKEATTDRHPISGKLRESGHDQLRPPEDLHKSLSNLLNRENMGLHRLQQNTQVDNRQKHVSEARVTALYQSFRTCGCRRGVNVPWYGT